VVSHLENPDSWRDEGTLIEWAATQLARGRLALVLGAGASHGFGFPGWSELTDRLFRAAGVVRPTGTTDDAAAEMLLHEAAGGDDVRFASLVRDALYRGYDFDPSAISSVSLLAAIGTLCLASSRGRAAYVVTYNFDVVLEEYLRYFGIRVDTVAEAPAWNSTADVRILHPHGALHPKGPVTRGVVYCLTHFDRIIGNAAEAWHRIQLDVFSSHTCIFIGLSGEDRNLSSLLTKTKDSHACRRDGHHYWGIRLTRSGAENDHIWRPRGVHNHVLVDYDRIAPFLLAVCRRAAELATL